MKIVLILLPFLMALAVGCQGHQPRNKNGLKLESVDPFMTRYIKDEEQETGSGINNDEDYGSENVDSDFSDSETVNSTKSIIIEKQPMDETNVNDDDDDDSKFDILTKEGQPGWMENLLKQAKSKSRQTKRDENQVQEKSSEQTRFNTQLQDGKIPLAAVAKLTTAFGKYGTKATGAKKGLTELKNKWNTMDAGDRETLTGTLQGAADNIEVFAEADENPVGAVQAALNMVAQFSSLAGPTGQLISVALSFTSGFLSLFGMGGKEEKSVGEIVREQIDEALDKYYHKVLTNEANGAVNQFETSKSYADNLAQNGKKLTKDQALLLRINVPLWQGVKFMGILASEIRNLLKANKRADAKKVLQYIELYTNMAGLKDMIMQEVIALLPDEFAPNRAALMAVQKRLRGIQKLLLKFLYEAEAYKFICLNYFDPDIYPITDTYLGTVLKIKNYDRSLAGIWCITPSIRGQQLVPLSWSRKYSQLRFRGHPYINTNNDGCFWKLVPHGKHLFTIVNMYGCPTYAHCGEYMSWDRISGWKNRATVETDADLWEIYGSRQKRIRNVWGCDKSSGWCNTQLGPQWESVGYQPSGLFYGRRRGKGAQTFGLKKSNVGFIWWITKKPMI